MNPLLAIGIWLVEHLSPSQHRHALCGDLLQQRHAGGSASWLTREILAAIGLAVAQRFRRIGMPLLFSAAWSVLFRSYASHQPAALHPAWVSTLSDFILRPTAHLLLEVEMVVMFIWLGFVVFACVRRDILRHLTMSTGGLAYFVSHAILLFLVMVWPKEFSRATFVPMLTQRGFYLGWINLPVAISLLIAVLCVLPNDTDKRHRRLRAHIHLPPPAIRPQARWIRSSLLLVLCAASLNLSAQTNRMTQVEQCTLPPVHVHGQPLPCVPLLARMEQHHVHGVSVAVVHNGVIEWVRGYGHATDTTPVTPETLFQAGSISKPLTAMAALHLVQQEKLLLDSNVNAYLRSWKIPADSKFPNATVTVRELLTHTAGFTVHGFPGYAAGASVPTLVQVLDGTPPANTPAIRLEKSPGTEWNYSGGGYTVMQQLLVDVSGESFSKLLRSSVLEPIGMNHSTYEQPLPAALLLHAASPYLIDGGPVAGGTHTYPEQAAAGLWTTPNDLARYILEVQRSFKGKANNVISTSLTQQMLTAGKGMWGLGLEIGGSSSNPYFSHGGVNEGFESLFVAYTHTGDGAVVMTNAQGGSELAEEIMRGIATAYNWPDFRQKELTPIAVPSSTLSRYVGTYSIPSGPAYVVTLEDGRLYSTTLSAEKAELLPQSATSFFLKDAEAEIQFNPNANGEVRELTILFKGHTFAFTRTK